MGADGHRTMETLRPPPLWWWYERAGFPGPTKEFLIVPPRFFF